MTSSVFLTVLPADLVDPVMSRDYASKRKADLTSNRAAAPRIISSLRDFPFVDWSHWKLFKRRLFAINILETSSGLEEEKEKQRLIRLFARTLGNSTSNLVNTARIEFARVSLDCDFRSVQWLFAIKFAMKLNPHPKNREKNDRNGAIASYDSREAIIFYL